METKELKIQAPEGYEIDKENSTFECIKFKHIKKDITYKNVSNKLFNDNEKIYYYTDSCGDIQFCQTTNVEDANNATTVKQLKRILALNQLLNIAEYYNRLHTKIDKCYNILYDMRFKGYRVSTASAWYRNGLTSIEALFNRAEDAQAVINNPNFREILDTIYKD
nr:MAG TPA: hypothetical protein [Crassvirales sp.]